MADTPERIWITYEGDRCKPFPEQPEYLRGTWTSVDFQNGRRPSYIRADIHAADLAAAKADAETQIAALQMAWSASDYELINENAELKAEVARLRADLREAAMQGLADMGQAQDAYDAQLKAETEVSAYREKYWSLCQRLASDERSRFSDNSIWPEVTEVAAAATSGGNLGGSDDTPST